MITSTSWRGKRYAVLGLARSGLATVRALLASGATVVAWDANEKARLDFIEAFKGFGRGAEGAVEHFWGGESNNTAADDAKVELGNLEVSELAEFDALVVSPGVPLNRDHIAMLARSAGTPIIGDIELFAEARAEMPAHRVVGITGTNGKSTTTALIHHIIETAAIPTRMGGNIGLPILGQEPLPVGGVYVLELSSYQIDLTHSLDCDVAVLLNITPDHLDRYAGFDAYAESKVRLFEMQSKGHAAIVGIGDETCANIARRLADFGRREDLTRIAPGISMDQSRWPALQGVHNAQNALAAIAACQALGIVQDAIDKGLETFPGLPHRMERVKTVNGVLFVNDSKATNADSTAPALSAYPKIHWILGGKAKTNDLDACRPGFAHVVKAYTIGDAGEMFAQLLEGEMPVERSGTLDVAVKAAAANAQPGEVVLLSPACASFDQFKDYEARGQAFRDAVEALG